MYLSMVAMCLKCQSDLKLSRRAVHKMRQLVENMALSLQSAGFNLMQMTADGKPRAEQTQ